MIDNGPRQLVDGVSLEVAIVYSKLIHGILKFRELNFRGLLRIREKRENYAPRKFGRIRYNKANEAITCTCTIIMYTTCKVLYIIN